ncbi:MAG: porin family protein [Bacteroidales bacterium]|nr:porin family protein [Bacteroidales bacterium]
MKKIFLVIVMLICSLSVFSQHRGSRVNWLSLAVKGGYGNFMMMSKDLKDVDDLKLDFMSPSYCFGGRLGVIFGDYVGVSFEYLGSGFNQNYEFTESSFGYDGKIKFNSSDMLALFRYSGDYGFYAELGPKFTTIKKVENVVDEISDDQKDIYNDKFTSIAFGLGFMPYNGDRVQVSLGARFAYGLKAMNKDNANSFGLNMANVEIKPFSTQIMLEVNYLFAQFGRANCGRHGIQFFK